MTSGVEHFERGFRARPASVRDALRIACAILSGCGGEVAVEPLAPLPPPAPVMTERFVASATCGQCHLPSDTALRDAAGRDVSPVGLWRSSMMALAARDPYYLAIFAEERARASDAAAVDRACTRCHAPAGTEERAGLGFDALVAGIDAPAAIGRDGVTCTLCHQIADRDLGTEASFTGGFHVDFGREIYGPHAYPYTEPMKMFVSYTPAEGAHVAQSELCATCHTVIVRAGGHEVVEQATYLEWRSSSVTAKTCQTCHVPTDDIDGTRIATPIARLPGDLSPRAPVGRHVFVGGNAYMLRALASAEAWANTGLPAGELEAAAAGGEAHLATAATLRVTPARDGDALVVAVTVENRTGHKLPTGYPSRRMWLHVTVRDGGSTVFESGRATAGALPGDDASAPRPHLDAIDRPDQVQVWEAVLVDASGSSTHRTLDARAYGKDDRIPPAGFAPSAADRARVANVGVDGDASFQPGADTVTYRVAGVPAGAAIDVELLYQSLAPSTIDAIERGNTAAGARFTAIARAQPGEPIAMTRATATAP